MWIAVGRNEICSLDRVSTREMGFARDIANRVCVLEAGEILEKGPPERIFTAPEKPRTRQFLGHIIAAGRL